MKNLKDISIQELDNICILQVLEMDVPYVIKNKSREEIKQDLKAIMRDERIKREERKYDRNKQTRVGAHFRMTEQEYGENTLPHMRIIEYLKENEKSVDKRKLLLISLYRYKTAMDNMNDIHYPDREKIEEGLKTNQKLAQELLKDEKEIIISRLGKRKKDYFIEIISSSELLHKMPSQGERKQERESVKAINTLSEKALFSAFLIVNNYVEDRKEFAKKEDLITQVIEVMKAKANDKGTLTQEDIDAFEYPEKYIMEYPLERKAEILYPGVRKVLEGLEKYIYMDKVCLYTIMKAIQISENGNMYFNAGNQIDPKKKPDGDYLDIETYLPEFYSVIKGKKVEITLDGKTYTTEDAEKAMEKYANGRYMSDFAINDMIQELLQSGQPASVIPKEQLQYIREYITIHRGVMSTSELKYMIRIGLLIGQDVLKMYENRKRSLENVLAIQEDMDLKEFLTPAYIVEKFSELENLNDEEHAYEKETIKRYLNLYKALYLEGKSEEDLEKAGKELIEELKKSEKEHDERTESRKQEGLLRYGLISERTYALLASKGMIRSEDFMSMYQKDVIRLKTIEQLKEDGIHFDNVDIEAYIIDSYMKIRENENSDKTELKKYIALYKVLTLKELSEEEINEKANDLVMNIGTRIESDIEAGKQIKPFGKEDRKSLYDLEAIPIDTVVLWADKGELIELLKSEFLVPKDMRKLYQQNNIILHDIQEIIESQDVKLEQKIAIINIVFPSPEDAEIREMLFGKITELDETVVSEKESTHREVKQKHGGAKPQYHKHIFDTAVRYNSWIQSDENVKMEILNDGHIAVHLPNVKDGLAVMEQFYKLKTAKDGKKKMEDAWGVGGFVLPEDDYQENKNRFITKDHRVKRQQLGKVVKELAPKLEAKGISGNLHHRQNYPELVQKLIGMPVGLAKAKTEEDRQKAIKTLKDSKQYSSAEMKRMEEVSQAWQKVRESRRIYEK